MEPTTTPIDFMSIFTRLRGTLSNEELGVVAMSGNVWSEYELGKLLRVAMDVLESAPAGEMTEITKTFTIGEDFYEAFSKFARRKLARLAANYSTSDEAIRAAVKADDNFEIIKGSESGIEYVRLSSKLR